MCLMGRQNVELRTRGVMIPFFSGIGTGVGIVSKRTGIGIAWNRFQSGIDSRAGIGSVAGIDSKCEKTPVYKYKYEIIFLAIIITNCLKNQQNID